MYRQKLSLALNSQFGIPFEEQILLIKKTGFDGFAIDCNGKDDDISSLVELGKNENMFIDYVHAPFGGSAKMWEDSADGDYVLRNLKEITEVCAEYEVSSLVVHAFIGFFDKNVPTQVGIDRYGELVKRATELGVKIAFENTEGEEYLFALMDTFSGEKFAGFCWDTGHELCYNKGKDLMAMFGDRLFVTHLNDNLGVCDFGGKITYIDDLHLLPFDGIADWHGIAQKIAECNFDGPLSFELNTLSKPDRHENDKYSSQPIENYIAECYARACRVASLYLKAKEILK